jgi:hypothetical protein
MREWGYFHVAGHASDLIGGKEGISGAETKSGPDLPDGRRLSFFFPFLSAILIVPHCSSRQSPTHDDLSPLHSINNQSCKAAKLLKQNETGLSAYRTAKRDGTDE